MIVIKYIDMRCRPPLPTSRSLSMYDPQYATKYAAKFGNSYPAVSAKEFSLELLIQEMDEANISCAVYQVSNCNDFTVNEEAAALCRQYPDRFKVFGGTFIYDIEKSIADIKQYAVQGPFSGINIDAAGPHLGENSVCIDDERLFPFYEICEANQIPISFAMGGYAYPDPSAYMPIRLENIAKIFPKMRIVVCHGGWPYFRQISGVCLKYPQIYIVPDGYLMRMPSAEDFILAANYLLPNQIMFGTSYPFHDQKLVAAYYCQAGFSKEAFSNVMYDNAAKLLGLNE